MRSRLPLSRHARGAIWTKRQERDKLNPSGTQMDNSSSSKASGEAFWRERRSVPRYSLIAVVEVVESTSDTHLSGRVSEISRKGCYIDVLNALPPGTAVRLWISRDEGTFETPGKIIYAHPGMGMGVGFVDTLDVQMQVLDAWLADLAS
ncbi:MAG: PilZ domain-containing protein [Candidatus Acidiferrales bacterium]